MENQPKDVPNAFDNNLKAYKDLLSELKAKPEVHIVGEDGAYNDLEHKTWESYRVKKDFYISKVIESMDNPPRFIKVEKKGGKMFMIYNHFEEDVEMYGMKTKIMAVQDTKGSKMYATHSKDRIVWQYIAMDGEIRIFFEHFF